MEVLNYNLTERPNLRRSANCGRCIRISGSKDGYGICSKGANDQQSVPLYFICDEYRADPNKFYP